MAIDGTPPFKLPNGAQPIILNDFDLLTVAQFPVSGTGPYTVPTGHRLVITGAYISWVEANTGTALPTNGREILLQVSGIEGDGHPITPGQVHTFFGICVPPTQFEEQTGMAVNLAIPVRAGGTVSVAITAGTGQPPFVSGTTAQIIIVWGWLETQTA